MVKKMRNNKLKLNRFCLFSLVVPFFLISLSVPMSFGADKPYPDKPINIIVGFAPGGISDLIGAIMADKMGPILGQKMIRVYKPGGGGTLAASYAKGARPDGYTLLMVGSTTFSPPEVRKTDYTFDDFTFTGIHATGPNFVTVRANSEWKNLKDFIDEAKKAPGKMTLGTAGVNTGGWFVYKLFAKHAKIELTNVPFKSSGEAVTALLGGHIDSYFGPGVGTISEATLVRSLATDQRQRLPEFPDLPTFTELGFPVNLPALNGFAFPKGTPEEIVDKITNAQKRVIEQDRKEIEEKMRRVNMYPTFFARTEALREYKRSYDSIRDIVKQSGLSNK